MQLKLVISSSASCAQARRSLAVVTGRRVDTIGSDLERFPLRCIPLVKSEIANILSNQSVEMIVSSGACGVDLLALEAAMDAGIRFHLVLPFDCQTFRATSVVDRPGNWGSIFDDALQIAKNDDLLTILNLPSGHDSTYTTTNDYVLDIVSSAGVFSNKLVIVGWEGNPKLSGPDVTDHLRRKAILSGYQQTVVNTCCH